MPIGRMRASMTILSVSMMALVVVMLFWLGQSRWGRSAPVVDVGDTSVQAVNREAGLTLGLIPERDVFAQRRRYRALADYLSGELGIPVTLATSNTYHGALNDMAEGRINAAFMGSFVATLAIDQLDAHVLVKPETASGVTTYRGIIFVRQDSPIRGMDDLPGGTLSMVRTTTAGHLFPIYALSERGLLTSDPPVMLRWAGTHDRVIEDVFTGAVDAGAAKDLRIDAFEREHPGTTFRRLAVSEALPNNALLVSPGMDAALADRLTGVLLGMSDTPEGRQTLEQFGAVRFLPCESREYQAVYNMAERLGPGWGMIGVRPTAPAVAEVEPDKTD